ncbi:DNA primase [Bifidobacterium choloepi]|uniref:DNA primase n=1 Tax=Bifidobacterium choloepi TaxID=2614131 RepID=A0A6I5NGE6_9BIFI|nr:DNA primase [Bifidobacterium choloepi]NEG69443.1 DNA primase [Bifidobacterium choloepi]
MAGMIKKEDIEKVRAAADLYDIVSASVRLKASGAGAYVGLCPFHDEKTPSFNVRPSVGMWHCFGCGKGGDVFKYVEEMESLDFRDAVEFLADKYRIELHYDAPRGNLGAGAADGALGGGEVRSKRARLIEANEEAQNFFVSQITTKEALPARKLLDGRNFTQADCAHFGCGYAPQGWDNLVRHLSNKGFTHQEILDAGLARQGQRGIYDYFRGRVTWPIRDSTGRTLGFGARKLYEDDAIAAKYINTPDTQLYHKEEVLYGIDLAKKAILKKRQVVIVEGYTDVMAMHLAGVDTAVATCGTAFGEKHAKMVRRFVGDDKIGAIQLVGPTKVAGQSLSSRVVFTFDGDSAGQKAALHAFGLDTAFLSQTFVAVAEDNLDPCDLRIERGDEAVRSLIDGASPLYDFVIDTVVDKCDTAYTTGQMAAVKAAAPLVAQIRDRSLEDLYTRKTARRIGIDLDIMQREVRSARSQLHVRTEDAYAPRFGRFEQLRAERGVSGPGNPDVNRAALQALARQDAREQDYYRVDDEIFMSEQQFMATLIQLPRAIDRTMFDQLATICFVTPVFRTLYQAVTAAGGLPDADTPMGLWLHNLTKAGGPALESVINELAVMPLPLPGNSANQAADAGHPDHMDQALRAATPTEARYARELTARLLDLGYMRTIGNIRRRMAQLPEGDEKTELLARNLQLEQERQQLRADLF